MQQQAAVESSNQIPELTGSAAVSVVPALEGLLSIAKRSATLDGAIPLRAAQWCKPFLDGNSAGFHLQFVEPAVLHRSGSEASLQMTDEGLERVNSGYDARIARLVEMGVLAADGYWHRRLRDGFAWQEEGVFYLWSGHIVRPAAGVWLHIHTPYNRKCQVKFPEFVIADDAGWTPVVLPLDIASVADEEIWLDSEIGCITPLSPSVTMQLRTLREQPEPGHVYNAFYDPDKPRKHGHLYRENVAQAGDGESVDAAVCSMVTFGGPQVHRIRTFERFANSEGWRDGHPAAGRLEYGEIAMIADMKGRWDGMLPRDFEIGHDEQDLIQLRLDWEELFGAASLPVLGPFEYFARGNTGPQRREPIMTLHHWLFGVTPTGWSSFVDAYDVELMEGLRGVTATDVHPGISPIWQFQREGRFCVSKGTPVGRMLPVPRKFLQRGMEMVAL